MKYWLGPKSKVAEAGEIGGGGGGGGGGGEHGEERTQNFITQGLTF